MDYERVVHLLAGLTLMKFFPANEAAMIALAKMVAEFAETEGQVDWLVRRVLSLYSEWPGAAELRACFCSRFKPRDGIERHSSVYLDGIPSEKPSVPQLPQGREVPALPPGHVASVDPELDGMISQLAEALDMNRPRPRLPRGIASPTEPPREPISMAPNPNFRPITGADMERAVDEMRTKRALAELYGDTPTSD